MNDKKIEKPPTRAPLGQPPLTSYAAVTNRPAASAVECPCKWWNYRAIVVNRRLSIRRVTGGVVPELGANNVEIRRALEDDAFLAVATLGTAALIEIGIFILWGLI